MLTEYFDHILGHPGWFAINVLAPVLLPFIVIAVVATAIGGWDAFVLMIKKSVNQGQLFWVALSMQASMGYEAFSAYAACAASREAVSWALGFCMVGAFVSSLFIAVNTVQTLNRPRIRTVVVYISLVIAAFVACGYPALRALLSQC